MATKQELPSLPETVVAYPVVANITFPEGPIFDDAGYLYFVNYLETGTLGRMAPDGTVEVWLHTGGQVNGLKYDGRGHVIGTDYGLKRVTRFDLVTRNIQVLTDNFEGKAYLGPNDLCLDQSGNVYFTDPGDDSDAQHGAVYRIAMGLNNEPVGLRQLDDELPGPNGLAIHPDGSRFYLALTGDNSVIVYDHAIDGTLSNRRLLHQFHDDTVDGMMFDEFNRLYVARWTHGTIDVLDSDTGALLASYPMGGECVTNMCWWGTSLYVTVAGRHSIERLDIGVRGADVVPR